MTEAATGKPDYGIDAPNVLRNLFLFGILCSLIGLLGPRHLHLGPVDFLPRPMFLGTGIFLLAEASLFLLYVKVGKFRHRDFMLNMHPWRGDEVVLDVGCGRGLLLAGAARRLAAQEGPGHCTGIDIWSNVDMGGNSASATRRNLDLEGISGRCTLTSAPAQEMPFPDDTFDVVVSNLCLHNISQKRARLDAVRQIARVLRPGGTALISDYKNTAEYAEVFREAGLPAARRWGSPLFTFPPLRVVIARKEPAPLQPRSAAAGPAAPAS